MSVPQPVTADSVQQARIGPNAIIQTARVIDGTYGADRTRQTFLHAGLDGYVDQLPAAMVIESEFAALARAVVADYGADAAAEILTRAGEFTAGYLLENRIPRPVQTLLRLLPRRPALWLLLTAIRKNAWTFVGSGTFSYVLDATPRLLISESRLCCDETAGAAICHFYQGTFRRLLRTLVDRRTELREVECQARGAPCCTYRLVWS